MAVAVAHRSSAVPRRRIRSGRAAIYPDYADLVKHSATAYLTYSELLSTREWQNLRAQILYRDSCCCQHCGASERQCRHSLHVHHRYYIQGYLPWEYVTSALVSLCADCHYRCHQNHKPTIYQEVKPGKCVALAQVTRCCRCNGTGYIAQYKHVEDGLCFRCYGARYEELIAHPAGPRVVSQSDETSNGSWRSGQGIAAK